MGKRRRNPKRRFSERIKYISPYAKIALYSCATIIVIILFSVIFAVVNVNSSKFMNGIKVAGVDISGLTYLEAKELVEEKLQEKVQKGTNLTYLSTNYILTLEDLNCEFNVDEVLNEGFKYGRTGNVIIDNYQILALLFVDKDIPLNVEYSDEQLQKQLTYLEAQLEDRFIDNQIYVEDDELYIIKGRDGMIITAERFNEIINYDIRNLTFENSYEIPVSLKRVAQISVEELHEQIYQEPKDAYYTESPFAIHSHIVGIDFENTIEEVEAVLAKEAEDYIIPLKLTTPEITIDNLTIEAFPDVLAQYSTKYDITNKNKTTNLEIAVSKLNEVIIQPGEEFSYNQTLGARTVENGYKEAAIYSGGKITTGLGGGICQISSTLYNAVLLANLEITERTNHMFLPSYVGEGRDATVYYGSLDFKFKNNRKYPVKIVATATSGIAKISIMGISDKEDYAVVIETEILETIPYTTRYIQDDTLQSGQEVVIQEGKNGAKVKTYKVLKKGLKEVSRTLISEDTYRSLEETIARNQV